MQCAIAELDPGLKERTVTKDINGTVIDKFKHGLWTQQNCISARFPIFDDCVIAPNYFFLRKYLMEKGKMSPYKCVCVCVCA